VKFIGRMAMVRNSTGSDGYVADEIILSRAGKRVRVVNTDAEGRMAMADVLCQAKEEALAGAVNPRLLTIATLTGHAVRCVGEGYSIVMVNDPAKEAGVAQRLQAAGDKLADPFEYSTVRREDWTMITPKYATEDVVGDAPPSPPQSVTRPSDTVQYSSIIRHGPRSPVSRCVPHVTSPTQPPLHNMCVRACVRGFLTLWVRRSASGLDKHMRNSQNPISYAHLDIAAAALSHPKKPSGAPVAALLAAFAGM
jgi:leucyl aminopeptidase